MSTSPRRQPALFLVTLLVAGLLSAALAPATAAKPSARAHARLLIDVLPPISAPSDTVAPSSAALSVVQVRLRPRSLVLPVRLQQRTGLTWHTIGTKTVRRGEARFPVAASAGATYRAVLPGSKVHSAVAVDNWKAPGFVDEFEGTSLGPAWQHRIQFLNPWGGRSCSKGDPAAVAVAGGTVRLSSMVDTRATRECPVWKDKTLVGRYPYRLNANISTQHSADFLYGVAAARMRFPRSLGQHASFWLQPRGLLDYAPTPWGAEIDVVEWYGAHAGKQNMASAVHAPMPDGSKRQIGGQIPDPQRFLATRSDTWWTRFHVFSVEWTPRQYVFRIDGHEVWRTDQGISHSPEFLILSMLSSDFELPYVGSDPEPRTAEVDWVAFWQTGA